MPITEKTAKLSMKLVKQYLGFQFLLTSPSPFVPPGTPNMRVMFYDFLNLTNEGVMRHIEGCVVQGGDVVGFRRRPLNVSTHLAAIFSSVSGILSPLRLYPSSDPSFCVELLSLLLLHPALSVCSPA